MWPMLMRLGCAMSQMSATFGVEKFSKMDVHGGMSFFS